MFAAVARAVEQCVSDFKAQEFANTARAFAKAGQFDAMLFKVVARAAEERMYEFNAQDLATLRGHLERALKFMRLREWTAY